MYLLRTCKGTSDQHHRIVTPGIAGPKSAPKSPCPCAPPLQPLTVQEVHHSTHFVSFQLPPLVPIAPFFYSSLAAIIPAIFPALSLPLQSTHLPNAASSLAYHIGRRFTFVCFLFWLSRTLLSCNQITKEKGTSVHSVAKSTAFSASRLTDSTSISRPSLIARARTPRHFVIRTAPQSDLLLVTGLIIIAQCRIV